MRWNFRNLLAVLCIVSIFTTIWAMGAGLLSYAADLVKGIIIGGIMQWGALIIQFYFRKRPADEGSVSK